MRALWLIGAVACAAPEPPPLPPAVASAVAPVYAPELWLDPEEPGYRAQQLWGLPLPLGFTVVELKHDTFEAACEVVSGEDCRAAAGAADIAAATVLIRADLPAAYHELVVLHEMGHILRRSGGHLDCYDTDVMCAEHTWGVWPQVPTESDREFVLTYRGQSSPGSL